MGLLINSKIASSILCLLQLRKMSYNQFRWDLLNYSSRKFSIKFFKKLARRSKQEMSDLENRLLETAATYT